jgi:hypothetical protein
MSRGEAPSARKASRIASSSTRGVAVVKLTPALRKSVARIVDPLAKIRGSGMWKTPGQVVVHIGGEATAALVQ